jgi:hypothetical protein
MDWANSIKGLLDERRQLKDEIQQALLRAVQDLATVGVNMRVNWEGPRWLINIEGIELVLHIRDILGHQRFSVNLHTGERMTVESTIDVDNAVREWIRERLQQN